MSQPVLWQFCLSSIAPVTLSWSTLADGFTDNIINNLSRVSKLRVMSRSAVFRYK